jgi:DNA adenine methylase
MNTKNTSPLRYPGGKTRTCKILDDIFIKYFDISDIDTIISPFFGGGSFEFFLQNKYNKPIIANDKFIPLITFWNQSKSNPTALCEVLREDINQSVTKDKFMNYRSTMLNTINPLQIARQYFVINRCSNSGATLSGGFSLESSKKRFTLSSVERIDALDLRRIDFHHSDFQEFLHTFGRMPKSFLFLDPPYSLGDSQNKLYGISGDLHETFNHEALYVLLSTVDTPWMMTYNDCPHIRELYKNYTICNVHWSYGMNKSKKSSEIVVLSLIDECRLSGDER